MDGETDKKYRAIFKLGVALMPDEDFGLFYPEKREFRRFFDYLDMIVAANPADKIMLYANYTPTVVKPKRVTMQLHITEHGRIKGLEENGSSIPPEERIKVVPDDYEPYVGSTRYDNVPQKLSHLF